MEVGDVPAFIQLQDGFVEEHRLLASGLHPQLRLRDWQLSLCCPRHVIDKPGARERHATSMVLQNQEVFKTLVMLKAVVPVPDGQLGPMAGYIMYEVYGMGVPGSSPGKRQRVGSRPWVQVRQVFVKHEQRLHGCGGLLFNKMLQAVPPEARRDIRLSVLDLNTRATEWYRSKDFVAVAVRKEFIGTKDEGNVVVYTEMQRRGSPGAQLPEVALFKAEVLHEVVTIDYPDDQGTFEVRIVRYDDSTKWHHVDSKDLSLWDGEDFVDELDLSALYRDGRVTFHRHLSEVYRDAELRRRADWRRKVEAKALRNAELERAKREREEALQRHGRAARQRRRLNSPPSEARPLRTLS